MPRLDMDFASVDRSKAEARTFYTRISPYYDTLAASEKKFIQTGLDLLDASPGDRILEIGSGTGFALLDIALQVEDTGHAYGVDISPGMIRVAHEKLKQHQVRDQVSLILDDAHILPLASQSIDGIFMSFTLELFHTPELPQVLKECHRVIRQDGRMCVVSLSTGPSKTIMSRIYEWLHDRYPRLLDCRPIPVGALLEAHGYRIQKKIDTAMLGLPVSIILVRKTQEGDML